MERVRYTLLADGRSDSALMNIIDWLFTDLLPKIPVNKQFADFSKIQNPPPNNRLDLRIKRAIELYPCEIVFVHRDAESSRFEDFLLRKSQIQESFDQIERIESSKLVKVIPVRMMETWLLIDELAIKVASGNRNNRMNLDLPSALRLESIADPKSLLDDLLRLSSGNRSRRLDRLNLRQAVHRVAENIEDYSLLRQLPAFNCFETDLRRVLEELGFEI
jgi:hypothetical protein